MRPLAPAKCWVLYGAKKAYILSLDFFEMVSPRQTAAPATLPAAPHSLPPCVALAQRLSSHQPTTRLCATPPNPLAPGVLFYGLDYDGNVCNRPNARLAPAAAARARRPPALHAQQTRKPGDPGANPQPNEDLSGLWHRYWLNPDEVLAAGSNGFSLADASSICVAGCPKANQTTPRLPHGRGGDGARLCGVAGRRPPIPRSACAADAQQHAVLGLQVPDRLGGAKRGP